MHTLALPVLSFCLAGSFFLSTSLAQTAPQPSDEPGSAKPGDQVPGDAEGTLRWVVVFAERSFDLDTLGQRLQAARTRPNAERLAHVDAELQRLEALAAAEHAGFRQAAEAIGVRLVRSFWLVDACVVEASPEQAARLRELPNVRELQPDTYRAPSVILTSTNAKNHRVDAVQSAGVRGKGFGIAIVDSGQDASHAASGRPHSTYFVGGNPSNTTGGGIGGSRLIANYQIGTLPAEDPIAHGTSVAAVAAGEKWNTKPNSDRGHASDADIVGYGISDLASGYASLTTMVAAWQQVTADSAKHKLVVGNMSYDGSAPPTWVEQMAMDQCALTADLMVTASAGNHATNYAHYSHGATNIFAVGATEADVHKVAWFSSRGPLWTETTRNYPHLVANGVQMVLPLMDQESSERTRDGTSYAAAQVAGSALLFRSVQTGASALVTRAALLASTEDVHGKNRVAPYDDMNAYGYGYLRTDRLIEIAQNKVPNRILTGQLSATTPSARFTFSVQQGKDYAAALAWNRLNVQQTNWSDLNLAAIQGTTTLAESKSPRNTNERVIFRARSSGTVDFVVSQKSLEAGQVPFALVICEALPPFVPGSYESYGQACRSITTLPPGLEITGSLEIGQNYDLGLVSADRASVALLGLGLSDSMFGPVPLPLDLGPLGAPGCSLYCSFDIAFAHPTGNAGAAKQNIVIPNDKALIQLRYFHQALVLSTGTNPLGLVSTAGLRVRVGGDPY